MPWTRNALDAYSSEPPDWLKDVRKEQREQIYALRRYRQRWAAEVFGEFVAETLTGPGPWAMAAFMGQWKVAGEQRLISRNHMRRGGGPLKGFGPRWAERQLRALGYPITGERVQKRKADFVRGKTVSTSTTTDRRLIERKPEPAGMI